MHAFGNGLQNILDVQPGFHGNLKQIIFIFFKFLMYLILMKGTKEIGIALEPLQASWI